MRGQTTMYDESFSRYHYFSVEPEFENKLYTGLQNCIIYTVSHVQVELFRFLGSIRTVLTHKS